MQIIKPLSKTEDFYNNGIIFDSISAHKKTPRGTLHPITLGNHKLRIPDSLPKVTYAPAFSPRNPLP